MAGSKKRRLATFGLALTLVALTSAHAEEPAAQAVDLDHARTLFTSWSCGGCHILADAGAAGTIGPSLDANPNLTYEFVVSRIANGQGAMPPFAGALTDEEIAELSAYIMQVAKK